MKRLFIFITILTMLFMISACGNKEGTEESAKKNDTSITETKKEDKKDKKLETEKKNVELSVIYKVPLKSIYIDAPNYQEIEQAYTELFIVHESRYVAITASRDSVATDEKDAHNKTFEEFAINMQNYEGGVNSINIDLEENKSINGIEVYFFEGTINYGTDNIHEGYAVGYSFVMDGIPCEIIGSVIDEEQSTDLKEEIKDTVEAMMKSVRSEQ